jgi:hypothetical protein
MSAYRKISSIGKESPMLGKKHSDETRTKMSLYRKGHKGSIQPKAKKIMVTDLKTNSSTNYASINEAEPLRAPYLALILQFLKI